MENPYLEVEDDSATIVGDDETAKPQDAPKLNTRQVIRGPNGEELPEEVQATLARHLTSWDSSDSPKMPPEFKAVQSLFEFFSSFSNFQQSGTLLLAVAEVVEMLSDGMLSKVYQLHEAERAIMWTHSITKLEHVLESMVRYIGIDINETYRTEVGLYFETMLDIVKWHQEAAGAAYLKACEELGREPDHDFVQSGVISERTVYQKIAMGYPVARKDV